MMNPLNQLERVARNAPPVNFEMARFAPPETKFWKSILLLKETAWIASRLSLNICENVKHPKSGQNCPTSINFFWPDLPHLM